MEVRRSIILPQAKTSQESELFKTLRFFIDDTQRILNRGIAFGDNIDCRLVSFTSSATPDAENTIVHTLGKIPTGYIVYSIDKAAIIYNGTTTWTATNIYLKANVASTTAKIIVF